MREAVQRIYKERKALASSVKDTSSALAKLDAVLIGVGLVIVVFISLLIFNPANTLASLVPLATIILGFSFIFGHSAQVLFESVSLGLSDLVCEGSRAKLTHNHLAHLHFLHTCVRCWGLGHD